MLATLKYLKARIGERSTWIAIGASVGVAAALKWPWSLVSVIVGVIAALVPDTPQ
jgi:4-amino-4-deoxy-L-arabinose transferase-like glycosyltransferase